MNNTNQTNATDVIEKVFQKSKVETHEKPASNLPPKKPGGLGRWIIEHRIYFLVFAIPTLIMYIAYAVFKVHPFGDNSVLVLDLNGQYVYYYEMLRDAFWGKTSFIYNWGRNLSGETFGIFAYYLASPFMLIICLLPRVMMCGAIEIVQLAKIGTAAVTFSFFLKKTSSPKNVSLIVFSSCYALMAYMVVELMDPMWLDGLIYLPLIMWGVHRLINERVMLPYIIPLALMFMAHFYIGYMVGIFTLLYFIYYSVSREGRILPKNYFGVCVRFFFGTITAIMCASIVLITVYNSLKLGKLEFTEPDFTIKTQFDMFTFSTKLFPLSYDTVRPEGLPMIYCGTITLLLLPLFFLNSKISMKEKASKGGLLAVVLIFMYIKPLDMAMHGFQVPNWLPYRYSFAFCFVMLLIAYRAFENLDGITTKELGLTFFGLIAYLIYLDNNGYEHFQKLETTAVTADDNKYSIQGVWFSAIVILVMYILLYLYKKYNKKIAVSFALVCFVSIELFANSYDTLEKIDKDVAYSKFSSYQDYMIDLREAVDRVNEYDTSPFFRMESTYHRTVNDPIGTGYYGLSHSSSTMNAPALTALEKLGFAYGGHYTKYLGSTYITDAIFGIRYLMDWNQTYTRQTPIPNKYGKVQYTSDSSSKIDLYENPYALSLGFAADKMINTLSLEDTNPFANQNMMFNYILGENGEFKEFFTRVMPMQIDTVNLATAGASGGHVKYYFEDTSVGECHKDYVFEMETSGELYMYFPTDYERKCNVWLSTDEVFAEEEGEFDFARYFFEGDYESILNLGYFEKGTSVRVRVSIPTDPGEAYWQEEYFYTLDMDAFESAISEIKKNQWELSEMSDTYLEGTITSNGNQTLFTTIPYEEGWTIKVDGKKVEPDIVGGAFISIPLTEGKHTVTMKFMPNYFVVSIFVTIVGVLIAVVIFMFEYKNGKIIKRILKKSQ